MTAKVNVGIVGAANRGATMIKAYSNYDCCRIIAVADSNSEAFDAGYERHQLSYFSEVKKFSSADDMYKSCYGEIDWIIIASSDWTHYELTIKALKSGYNVFVEKPMCQNLEEAKDICNICMQKKLQVVVGFEMRFASPVVKAKEMLEKGAIGKLKHIVCNDYVSPGYSYYLRSYRWKKYSQSLLMQKGIHSIDLINYFAAADPINVYADGGLDFFGKEPSANNKFCRDCEKRKNCDFSSFNIFKPQRILGVSRSAVACDHCVFGDSADVSDNSIVIINYQNGIRASLSEIYFAPDYVREIRLIGTNGKLELTMDQSAICRNESSTGEARLTLTKRNRKTELIPVIISENSDHWGGDCEFLNTFLNAVIQKKYLKPDQIDGRNATAVAWAAEQSQKYNTPVNIEFSINKKKGL